LQLIVDDVDKTLDGFRKAGARTNARPGTGQAAAQDLNNVFVVLQRR
jgi:hypothetical protein